MGGHRVYIGHLARDASRRDLEDLFKDFGKILDVTVKTGFGFVEFADKMDAEDAVHDMHDTRFLGQRIVVELAMSRRRPDRFEIKDTNRIIVKNIPSKTTWQDLKDFMKKAGRVTFADILKDRPGEGVVEFARREDMKYALRELDNEKLNGSRVYLEEAGRRRRSRDRSRSPRRSSRRSRSRGSRSRSRDSRSRSRTPRSRTPRSRTPRSRTPSRSRSRSITPSRSRTPRRDRDRSRTPSRSRSRSYSSSRGRSSERRVDIKNEDMVIDVPVTEDDEVKSNRPRSRDGSHSSVDRD